MGTISKNDIYTRVAELLELARARVIQAVNTTMVRTYFEIGLLIVEEEQNGKERAEYGKQILKELSKRLTSGFGKGFSVENLDRMRYFYKTYSSRISSTGLTNSQNQPTSAVNSAENNNSSTPLTKFETQISETESLKSPEAQMLSNEFRLSWSHYLLLMRIDRVEERTFYEIEAIENNWSLRELQRQFNAALYERLALSRDKQALKRLAANGQMLENARDTIKDPYVLEFLGLPEGKSYSESELEQKLIDKLEHFLLELGKGYTFVGRQVRFSFDDKHFRVDLVFYNRILKSFVLIDLKIGELSHQDLGQMQMYVNYYDRFVKLDDENKTIGIVLCKKKNDTMVEITLPENNEQIFASKYQTVLPSKETLKKLLGKK